MQGNEFFQYFEKFPYLNKHFRGIFAIDTIPKVLKYREFCICNTDKSTGNVFIGFVLLKMRTQQLNVLIH